MKKLLLGIALSTALIFAISPIANATELICGSALINRVEAYRDGKPNDPLNVVKRYPIAPCNVDIMFFTENNQVYELTCEGYGVLLNAKLNMILIAQAHNVLGSVDMCLEYNFPGGEGDGFWCGIRSVADEASDHTSPCLDCPK